MVRENSGNQDEDVDIIENVLPVDNVDVPQRSARITVELPLLLVMMGISLTGVAVNNIMLYRTCVHTLHYDKDICRDFLLPDRSNATVELEGEVQKQVAFIGMSQMVIEAIVPVVLSLFVGVWSDKHGRKPLVIWPVLGLTISSMNVVVYSMLDNFGPWWLVVIGLPLSISGGFTTLSTGAYCYISDITTKENRSLRITILQACFAVGSVTGSVLSSHLLRAVGNVNLLLIATALYVSAYVFTLLRIKESLPGAIKGGLRSLLNIRLFKEMVSGCLKQRPNNARPQILLLALVNALLMFIVYGSYNLEYLYTRHKLHWAMEDYTLYSGVNTMIAFVGGFLGLVILQKTLGVGDLIITISALVSGIVDYIIKSLAVSSWHLYFGASISLIKGLTSPLIMSFLTKILPMEDTAKGFALLNLLDALCPILAPVVYTSVYRSTIDSFPGAFYMLSAAINALCVFLLGLVQYYRWRATSYQQLAVST